MSGANTNLPQISASQAQKEVIANENAVSLSPAALFAFDPATSTALTWGYYGGTLPGTLAAIADGTIALTDNATNYVEVDSAGVVSSNTTSFTAGQSPLYEVVTLAGVVDSYIDTRTVLNLGGLVPLGTAIEDALTAHAGGGKASAYAMDAAYNKHRFDTCATNGDSALLPAATVGRTDFVKNSGAADMDVYGAGTDQIDDASTATAYALPAGAGMYFECLSAGNWYTL